MSLKIKNLTKVYPNAVKAIDDLSLDIGAGMFGLLGPNGAGKSSLMRTIATLQNPDSGSISFNELDVLNQPNELRKVLGYLPQSFGVYPKVSAIRLLDYFAKLKGVASRKDRQSIVREVLELTNLYDVRKKHVSGYSGGMKQRFGIAQLLLNNPKLIIVDEPTAGLDPAERNRFLNVLRAVGSQNTVIFSTHIVEDVKELCTDMAVMGKGKILLKENPTHATAKLNGKIWERKAQPNEMELLESKHNVLSSGYNEDHSLSVRVFDYVRPDKTFEAVNPSLEDVYFVALNQLDNASI